MKIKVLLFCFLALIVFVNNNSFAAFSLKSKEKTDSVIAKAPAAESGQDYLKDFKNLSRHEKKNKIKEIKKAVKEYNAQKKAGDDVSTDTLLLVLIAILLPPVAVYLHEGETNNKFWISVLLTILGYLLFSFAGVFFIVLLPAILHALYIILGGG